MALFSLYQRNCLNVISPGEYVNGLNKKGAVSKLAKEGQVTGQGGRVAGDINDFPGRYPAAGLNQFFFTTTARGIKHYHINRLIYPCHYSFTETVYELYIVYASF